MDLLSAGPERVRPPRRRWPAAVLAVAVAGAAVVLAARSTAERVEAVPTPQTRLVPPDLLPTVVAVAVGSRWAYALVSRCGDDSCGYELRRRELAGGGWFPTALRTTRNDGPRVGPFLYADGDLVTMVDEPDSGTVYVSADGGATVQGRPMRLADPVAAVPAGGVLDLGLCTDCQQQLTVLSPRDGELHQLGTQPPFGAGGLQAVAAAGPVLWAVSTTGRREVLTAVSPDSGRSWRAVPVAGFPTGVDNLRVSVGPDGSAYLLGARTSPAGPGPLAEVWHVDGPGGTWRKLPAAPGPRGPVSVVPDGADAVVTDYLGQAWRLGPKGAVDRLPDVSVEGRTVGPGVFAAGPGGVLLGTPLDDLRQVVVLSADQGRSWSVEDVLG